MIPFFRKIRKKMADDNRPLKYLRYAIGEIVLVVIGILIALQINNWNQERKNRKIETYYLNSIKKSINLSKNELKRVIEDSKSTAKCADTLYSLLAHKKYEKLNEINIDSLLFRSIDYSILSLNDGGINEILNAGNLNIILNDEIRVVLASSNERIHKIRKFEGQSEYLAIKFKEYLMNYIDYTRLEIDSISSSIIPQKKYKLLSDPMLTNYLDDIFFSSMHIHNLYKEEETVLDSLDTLINQHLKD